MTLVTSKLEGVTNELAASKAAYVSVLRKNGELREMLGSMEEKAAAIGKLAKEKCEKLKREKEELMQQLHERQQEASSGAQGEGHDTAAAPDVAAAEPEAEAVVGKDGDASVEQNSVQSKADARAMDELRAKLKSTLSEVKQLTKALVASEHSEASLKSSVTSLKRELDAAKGAAHNQLERFREVRAAMEQQREEWQKERTDLSNKLKLASHGLDRTRHELSEQVRAGEKQQQEATSARAELVEELESKKAEIEVFKYDQAKLVEMLQEAGVDASEVIDS